MSLVRISGESLLCVVLDQGEPGFALVGNPDRLHSGLVWWRPSAVCGGGLEWCMTC